MRSNEVVNFLTQSNSDPCLFKAFYNIKVTIDQF